MPTDASVYGHLEEGTDRWSAAPTSGIGERVFDLYTVTVEHFRDNLTFHVGLLLRRVIITLWNPLTAALGPPIGSGTAHYMNPLVWE